MRQFRHGQEIGVEPLHGLRGHPRGRAVDHRALGGGGVHLDVGVGSLRESRHDGADWRQKSGTQVVLLFLCVDLLLPVNQRQ